MQVLYLSGNRIGDAGAAALAEGLKASAALQVLSLHDNRIGDAGAAALGEAPHRLLHIPIQVGVMFCGKPLPGVLLCSYAASSYAYNTPLPIIIRYIHPGDALRANATLKKLDLSGNPDISESGAAALAAGRKSNAVLKELHLSRRRRSRGAAGGGKARPRQRPQPFQRQSPKATRPKASPSASAPAVSDESEGANRETSPAPSGGGKKPHGTHWKVAASRVGLYLRGRASRESHVSRVSRMSPESRMSRASSAPVPPPRYVADSTDRTAPER